MGGQWNLFFFIAGAVFLFFLGGRQESVTESFCCFRGHRQSTPHSAALQNKPDPQTPTPHAAQSDRTGTRGVKELKRLSGVSEKGEFEVQLGWCCLTGQSARCSQTAARTFE